MFPHALSFYERFQGKFLTIRSEKVRIGCQYVDLTFPMNFFLAQSHYTRIFRILLRHSGRAGYLYSTALRTPTDYNNWRIFLPTSRFPDFLTPTFGGFINNILRGLLLIRNKLRSPRAPQSFLSIIHSHFQTLSCRS